jgi:Dolichyl-phosphate-mannose-protein mannosyltransferase
MESQSKSKIPNIFYSATFVLIILSLFKFLFHFIINLNGAYGFFRDEFYYIACSNHLAWGYVDQPPFSILMLKISRFILGDSLTAIRFLPALLGALTIFISGKIAKELGGGIFAQSMAAICMIIAPIYLALNSYYSMNSFDVFFWALSFYVLILIIKYEKKNLWYIIGIIIGLGLMNKISLLWFGGGLVVGLLLTKHRRFLLTKEPWIAFLIAGIIFIPYIIWQIQNDYPTLEFMRNALKDKYVLQSPIDFLKSLILMENPVTFPIWILGLYHLFFNKDLKQFRILPIIFITVLIVLLLNPSSKAEYLSSSFPILFAGGGIFLESLSERKKIFWPIPAIIILLAFSIWVAPLAAPVLPVQSYIGYAEFFGIKPSTSEKKKIGELPQFFADMFGWKKMTEQIANIYDKLTPEEKQTCVIFCGDYGQAGAINFYGRKYDLAPAISGHNNYFLWGPVRKNIRVVIIIGSSEKALSQVFGKVIPADTLHLNYSMPYENNQLVWICKQPKKTIQEIWQSTKHYE